MAPPKDIARSYPKRGLTADVGFRSEPTFCGDGSAEYAGTNSLQFDGDHTFVNGFSVAGWYWVDGTQSFNYAGFAGNTIAWGFPASGTYLVFYQKATSTAHQTVGGTLTPKQWNHIAFTLSQDGLTIKCYLNGVELTITQPSVAIVLPSLTTIGEAGIAAFQNSAPGAGVVLPYGGQMANQIWYDGVLTQDEVRQLMRAPNYAVASTIVTPQFYFELFSGITESTGNATTVEDRGTTTTAYGVNRPQLPRGLDLARGAAQARVYTGRCVDFDGTADRLIGATYDGGGTETTMLYWFNTDTTAGLTMPFVNGGASNSRNQLQTLISAGILRAMDGPTNIPFSIETGRWYMLAIVGDSGGLKKAYLDGVDGGSPVAYGHGFTINQLVIGARNNTPSQPFNGKIVGFKIFDVELTQAQVRELYHNPEQVLPTGVSASNLRRYYPLSDYNDTGGTGGRYFQDMGADGEPAEDQGSALMAFAQPVPCPQLGLQQSATRVYFENNATRADATLGAAPGTTCTMSAWVMVESTGNYQYIFTQGTSAAAIAWFGIAKNNSDNKLYTLQGGVIAAYSSLQLSGYGEWNHVVAMTKSTAPYVRFFINGVEDTSINDISMAAYNLTSTSVSIGGNPVYANHTQGFLNDCAIWDVELSDPEVASLYNSGVQGMDVSTVQSSNLKGWWKCDDLTSFKDYSGNGANTTLTTGSFVAASFPENASGSTIVGDFSMKRKGVSVLNLCDDGGVTNAVIPAGGCQFSSYPDGATASLFFRLQKRGTGINSYFFSNLGTASTVYAAYPTGTSIRADVSDGSTRIVNVITAPTDSEWHHFALVTTYGSPSSTKMYLDGVLVRTLTGTLGAAIPTTLPMNIGSTGGSFSGKGPIACMRFYKTSLSDDEVEQIYRSDLRLIKGLENE